MKKIFLVFFFVCSVFGRAQDKEYLIDTVIIQSYPKAQILSTLKKSAAAYKKHFTAPHPYRIDFSMAVDEVPVASYSADKFFLKQSRKPTGNLKVDQTFFSKLNSFELDYRLFLDRRLRYMTDFPNLFFNKYPDQFSFKMRELEDIYQITCLNKGFNTKAVILISKKDFIPVAVFQSIDEINNNIKQTLKSGKKSSVVSYDVQEDNFTIFYAFDKKKLTIEDIESSRLSINYSIDNTIDNYHRHFQKVHATLKLEQN